MLQRKEIIGSQYILISKLGQGGFCEVWLAENIENGNQYAIKFVIKFHSDYLFSM